MNILVTGATGFIGSHICTGLLEHGHDIVGISRDIREPVKYIPVRCNIAKRDEVARLVSKFRPDAIIHTAAYHPKTAAENISELLNTNVKGTANLLIAARDFGVEKFIHSSSMSIYGKPQYLPVGESHPLIPKGPSFYPTTKALADTMIRFPYFGDDHVEKITLRYSGVFGPGRGWGAIYNFIQNVLNGEQPVIHSVGDDVWDLVHVNDIVNATILALETDGVKGAFNIGRGVGSNIKSIATTIMELSGNMDLIEKGPILGTEPSGLKFVYDISKAAHILRYEPTSLAMGLKRYMDYERGLRLAN